MDAVEKEGDAITKEADAVKLEANSDKNIDINTQTTTITIPPHYQLLEVLTYESEICTIVLDMMLYVP